MYENMNEFENRVLIPDIRGTDLNVANTELDRIESGDFSLVIRKIDELHKNALERSEQADTEEERQDAKVEADIIGLRLEKTHKIFRNIMRRPKSFEFDRRVARDEVNLTAKSSDEFVLSDGESAIEAEILCPADDGSEFADSEYLQVAIRNNKGDRLYLSDLAPEETSFAFCVYSTGTYQPWAREVLVNKELLSPEGEDGIDISKQIKRFVLALLHEIGHARRLLESVEMSFLLAYRAGSPDSEELEVIGANIDKIVEKVEKDASMLYAEIHASGERNAWAEVYKMLRQIKIKHGVDLIEEFGSLEGVESLVQECLTSHFEMHIDRSRYPEEILDSEGRNRFTKRAGK